MPSIDLQYVRSRQRGIRRAIERSSPVLVYSGPIGIVVIAANKSESRNRIEPIMDRIACVSRGEFTASQLVHRQAAQNAYAVADALSRGEETLICDAAVHSVSTLLANRYHTPIGEPLSVETVIVQLRETPEQDAMAHIGPDGSTRPFEKIRYLGETDTNGSQEEAEEARKQINTTVNAQWAVHATVAGLVMSLEAIPELASLFSVGRRRDIVHLDRAAFAAHKYQDIFKRLTF
jgi:hypothetical protein